MKIKITFDVSEKVRSEIAKHYGSTIPSYKECKDYIEDAILAMLAQIQRDGLD